MWRFIGTGHWGRPLGLIHEWSLDNVPLIQHIRYIFMADHNHRLGRLFIQGVGWADNFLALNVLV